MHKNNSYYNFNNLLNRNFTNTLKKILAYKDVIKNEKKVKKMAVKY